jgi:hypothetical protein
MSSSLAVHQLFDCDMDRCGSKQGPNAETTQESHADIERTESVIGLSFGIVNWQDERFEKIPCSSCVTPDQRNHMCYSQDIT